MIKRCQINYLKSICTGSRLERAKRYNKEHVIDFFNIVDNDIDAKNSARCRWVLRLYSFQGKSSICFSYLYFEGTSANGMLLPGHFPTGPQNQENAEIFIQHMGAWTDAHSEKCKIMGKGSKNQLI